MNEMDVKVKNKDEVNVNNINIISTIYETCSKLKTAIIKQICPHLSQI